jgi:hypothetical protein
MTDCFSLGASIPISNREGVAVQESLVEEGRQGECQQALPTFVMTELVAQYRLTEGDNRIAPR